MEQDMSEVERLKARKAYEAKKKRLPPEAKRALAEAEERRAAEKPVTTDKEHGGPKGLEPTRYGDWERKGIVSDF